MISTTAWDRLGKMYMYTIRQFSTYVHMYIDILVLAPFEGPGFALLLTKYLPIQKSWPGFIKQDHHCVYQLTVSYCTVALLTIGSLGRQTGSMVPRYFWKFTGVSSSSRAKSLFVVLGL